jgi:hypothetical protein
MDGLNYGFFMITPGHLVKPSHHKHVLRHPGFNASGQSHLTQDSPLGEILAHQNTT